MLKRIIPRILIVIGLLPIVFVLLVYFAFFVVGCDEMNRDPTVVNKSSLRRYAERDLGLNISGGELTYFYDDHGGFLGDGETCIVVRFQDKRMEQHLAARGDWQALPLDSDAEYLIYRVTDWFKLFDRANERGNAGEKPVIEHGWWLLIDRQPDSYKTERLREDEPYGINNRWSYNLTVGLYDSDTDTLYVLALDT